MSLRFLLHNGALIPILRPASAGSFAEVLGGEMGPVRRDIVIPKRCTRWEALRTTPHHVQVQGLDVDDLTLVDIDVGGLHSTSLTGGRLGKREHGRLGLGDNDKISKIVPQRVNLLPDKDILHVIRFLRLNTFRCFEKRWQNIIGCSLETQEMCFKVYFISKESFSYHYLCDQIGRGDHGRRLWKECNTWTAIGVVFIFHHLKEALITPERSKENGQLLVVGSTVLPSWNVCLIIFDPPVT
ncbi:unnamed protein product [Brassica oleracea var. botrytis]|uniref:(rape) hypothetical protein n=1 Tax=Brassica napus TaxID=3708 RepID=A0A816RNA2_BRANA|nr:unnamed protein product [Brassica napus]